MSVQADIPIRTVRQGDTTQMLLSRLVGSPERGTLLADAVRTSSTATTTLNFAGWDGLFLFLDVNAASGTGGLLVYVEFLDPVSGAWFLGPFTTAAWTTTGDRLVVIGPGIAVGTGVGISAASGGDRGGILSSAMRVRIIHLDASNYQYSLGYEAV